MIKNMANKYIKLSLNYKILMFLFSVTSFFYYLFLLPVLKYKDEGTIKLSNMSNTILSISNVGEEIAYLKSLLSHSKNNGENVSVVFKRKASNQNINFEIIYEHNNKAIINMRNLNFNKLLMLLIDLEINHSIIVQRIDVIKDEKINGNILVNDLELIRYRLENNLLYLIKGNKRD